MLSLKKSSFLSSLVFVIPVVSVSLPATAQVIDADGTAGHRLIALNVSSSVRLSNPGKFELKDYFQNAEEASQRRERRQRMTPGYDSKVVEKTRKRDSRILILGGSEILPM